MDHPSIYLVDLPGYGYAKISKEMKIDWQTIIEKYFFSKRDLKLAVILVDIRRGLEEEEHQIIDMLNHAGIRYAIAATKIDRADSSQKQKGVSAIQTACGKKPILCASPLRQGVPDLWKEIVGALKGQ
jgi:GTP-binding protein